MSRTVSTITMTFSIVAAIAVGVVVGHYFFTPKSTGYKLMAAPPHEDTKVYTYPIRLTPEADNTLEVSVRKNDRKCQENNNKGCVRFGVNTVGIIKFFLPDSEYNNRRCDDTNPNRKVITRIELTTTGSDDDEDKGTFDGSLDSWIQTKAFPGVDLSSGVIYDSTPEEGQTQIYLVNLNSHKMTEGIKSFWYRVTVSACNGEGGPWVTDPRGENQGMN